jgi:hypothetical protein
MGRMRWRTTTETYSDVMLTVVFWHVLSRFDELDSFMKSLISSLEQQPRDPPSFEESADQDQ